MYAASLEGLPYKPGTIDCRVWWQVVNALDIAQALSFFSGVIVVMTGALNIVPSAQYPAQQGKASSSPRSWVEVIIIGQIASACTSLAWQRCVLELWAASFKLLVTCDIRRRSVNARPHILPDGRITLPSAAFKKSQSRTRR